MKKQEGKSRKSNVFIGKLLFSFSYSLCFLSFVLSFQLRESENDDSVATCGSVLSIVRLRRQPHAHTRYYSKEFCLLSFIVLILYLSFFPFSVPQLPNSSHGSPSSSVGDDSSDSSASSSSRKLKKSK